MTREPAQFPHNSGLKRIRRELKGTVNVRVLSEQFGGADGGRTHGL